MIHKEIDKSINTRVEARLKDCTQFGWGRIGNFFKVNIFLIRIMKSSLLIIIIKVQVLKRFISKHQLQCLIKSLVSYNNPSFFIYLLTNDEFLFFEKNRESY